MATPRTVPLLSGEEANPYNANKSYAQDDAEPISQSADELYVEKRPKAPAVQEPEVSDPVVSSEPEDGQHDYKKRWANLKKRYDEQIPQFKQELDELKAKLAEDKTPEQPKTDDELVKWIEENPDLFKMVQKVAKSETNEGTKPVLEQLEEIKQREQMLERTTAKQEVLKVHGDLDEITTSDEFHEWAESQPGAIQKMIYENPSDSGALIRALDLYKADAGIKATVSEESSNEPAPDEDVSTLVPTRTTVEPQLNQGKVWTRREISKMSMDEFDRHSEEINRAMAEGRIAD